MNRAVKRRLMPFMSLWPPFLGAGIRVRRISSDFREAETELKLRFWNRNYVGTHFGGSLFAMSDAFYMLMLIENLGSNYIVWDKAATIRFLKPGRGTVRAIFRLTEEQVSEVRQRADEAGKHEATFVVRIYDDQDQLIAEVDKLIHIRRKNAKPGQFRSGVENRVTRAS